MTIDEVKRTAPPLEYTGQLQIIVGTPDDCRLIEGYGAMPTESQVEGQPILSTRLFEWWLPAADRMGKWRDRDV